MTKETKGSPSSEDVKGELVRQLATILDETNLSEIEYDTGSLRIRVARQGGQTTYVAPQAAPAVVGAEPAVASPVDPVAHPGAVKAPMVGVAYLASEPGSTPFVKPGDTVSEGQTVLLIEAMKTFNPVNAPRAGKVTSVLVVDGQPVEFDQPLIIIE